MMHISKCPFCAAYLHAEAPGAQKCWHCDARVEVVHRQSWDQQISRWIDTRTLSPDIGFVVAFPVALWLLLHYLHSLQWPL